MLNMKFYKYVDGNAVEFGLVFNGNTTATTNEPWCICVVNVDASDEFKAGNIADEITHMVDGVALENCAYEIEQERAAMFDYVELAELFKLDASKARHLIDVMVMHRGYFNN